MRFVYHVHVLPRLQASDVDLTLQALPYLSRRFLHLFSEHTSGAFFRFFHRRMEFPYCCADLLMHGFKRVFKN